MKRLFFFSMAGMFVLSCAPLIRNLNIDTTPSIQIGANTGGVIEYHHIEGETSASVPVDAVTGATRMAMTLGMHKQFNIKGHALETGLVYQGYDQTINYDDIWYNGARDIQFHQLRIPATYNVHFFKNRRFDSKLQLKLGVSVGATISKNIKNSGIVPDYSFTSFDVGPEFGIAIYPYEFEKCRLGLFINFYRGSKIYEDAYTKMNDGFGNNSYLKFGVNIHPFIK